MTTRATGGGSTPVGCVLAYAGCLNNNQLNALGWSICDGASLSIKQYPELFAAIGTCNGGDGNTHFNLPDHQGFFLRGVDPTGDVDKGARERTAPASGGATGARVGSIEGWATAAPSVPFGAAVPHVPDGEHNAYSGTNVDMLEPGRPTTFRSNGGGDHETRPVNAYVNFVVKLTQDALMPAGMVVPFAGNDGSGSPDLKAFYRFCDGTSLSASAAPELFRALGQAHGGTGDMFDLPDYRGRFLRGADNGAEHDPDSASRSAMASGGATGDAVGSIQGFATAPPRQPFTISVKVGSTDKDSDRCAGHSNAEWNSGSVTVSFTASGGDAESRPVNVTVDFYVLCSAEDGSADVFPIGGVIAFAGNVSPPSDAWLPCDGSSQLSTGRFAALFAAIGSDNGGEGGSFDVPDYQGCFLRGTDRGQGRDPDAARRIAAKPGGRSGDAVGSLQGWATAKPVTGAVTGEVDHLPVDEASNALAIWCSEVAAMGGPSSPQVGGGDAETRPLNANVAYYVKYASSTKHREARR